MVCRVFFYWTIFLSFLSSLIFSQRNVPTHSSFYPSIAWTTTKRIFHRIMLLVNDNMLFSLIIMYEFISIIWLLLAETLYKSIWNPLGGNFFFIFDVEPRMSYWCHSKPNRKLLRFKVNLLRSYLINFNPKYYANEVVIIQ